MAFALLSANFPNGKCEVKLENPTKEQLALQIENFSHLISVNIYNYSPVDYKKVQTLVPKTTNLQKTLATLSPSKILEIVRPAITLKLPEPTDESQVKKHKEKTRALEQIAVNAFFHALFVQIYPQNFTPAGKPAQPEVRIAADLPEWRVVKKVNLAKAEPKEVLIALSSMYNSLHTKYVSLSTTPLVQIEAPRKSYSNLLQNASSSIPSGKDFATEWKAFETLSAYGFPPIPSTETIGELYPEVKIAKPRGNFGSKKKK